MVMRKGNDEDFRIVSKVLCEVGVTASAFNRLG